jgi:hypothetical protein
LSHSASCSEQLSTATIRQPSSHLPASLSKNLNRLISAAVVSDRFRRLLLNDPVVALATGYNGEGFDLTPEEYDAVTSLRVSTIRDFAAQLLRIAHFGEIQPELRFAEATAK